MQNPVRLCSRNELVGVNSAWENPRMTPRLRGGGLAISPRQPWEWELVKSAVLPQDFCFPRISGRGISLEKPGPLLSI